MPRLPLVIALVTEFSVAVFAANVILFVTLNVPDCRTAAVIHFRGSAFKITRITAAVQEHTVYGNALSVNSRVKVARPAVKR